jgi:hypothetical protein
MFKDQDPTMGGSHEDVQTLWDTQQPTFERIKRVGFQQYYYERAHKDGVGFERAFTANPTVCICCDERIAQYAGKKITGRRIPGSGILEPNPELFAQTAHNEGITTFYSHAGCGAALKAAATAGIDTKNPAAVKEFVVKWTTNFCEKYGFTYGGHIEADDMVPPGEIHPARALYFDTTGKFDPSAISGLPRGFVLSSRFVADPAANAAVLMGIAFGDHGMGRERFIKDNFLIVIIAHSTSDVDKARKILAPILTNTAFEGCVRFETLVISKPR